MRVSNGELRQRATELGVSVSYWDWQGDQGTVSDETLTAIVAALEDAPQADGSFTAADAVAPVPAQRSWGFAVQLYSLRSRGPTGSRGPCRLVGTRAGSRVRADKPAARGGAASPGQRVPLPADEPPLGVPVVPADRGHSRI